jgi:hypothetical protein
MQRSDHSLRKSFELPGGRIAIFKFFSAPNELGTEITPAPVFGDRGTLLSFMAAYVEARRDFLEIVATVTGLRIAVIDELPDGTEAIGFPIAPAAKQ